MTRRRVCEDELVVPAVFGDANGDADVNVTIDGVILSHFILYMGYLPNLLKDILSIKTMQVDQINTPPYCERLNTSNKIGNLVIKRLQIGDSNYFFVP